jgi:sigma-B regulation protein RsbU (phosphoserine phosphatase)
MTRRSTSDGSAPPGPGAATTTRLDLSRIRHDLRTPINHILGYCEMLLEEEQVPKVFVTDLQRIHNGGRQLQALISEYFDDETFATKSRNVQQLCHELRTPVNHIIGYSEILQEQAEEMGKKKFLPDLKRIHAAAKTWLALMEEHLIAPVSRDGSTEAAPVVPLGVSFQTPLAVRSKTAAHGSLLVVDDDEANREMLARRLRHDGYTVTLAGNGMEALQLVRTQSFDVVLLDLIMPGLDGYQVLGKMKSEAVLCDIPVIMISALDQENGVARCIELGAEDYLAKPFNPVFLRARIGACLEKKFLRERERQTFEALKRSQRVLADELAEAAAYVRSLLPLPLEDGPVRTAWRFQPSTQLGGDAFGYHWLDEEHLAFYLLDVCGHGVGAALLSISVLNVLKSQALPGVNFLEPGAVLAGLNDTFTMEKQNNMFFTIWYGVLTQDTRELKFACGGHPPAVMVAPGEATPQCLSAAGPIVGGFPGVNYATEHCTLAPGTRLHLFSDGVYELARPDGSTVQLEEFIAELARPAANTKLDDIMKWAAGIRSQAGFEDDISILELRIL